MPKPCLLRFVSTFATQYLPLKRHETNALSVAHLEVVTFLFTDIEHSTRLAQQLREKYANLLASYRQLTREILARNGGTEIDVAGDGFFITFKTPHGAILAAAEIQSQLNSVDWALDARLKVRMGIHTGAALCSADGCTGVEVHLAARICDAAHGGQVLVSRSTRQQLGELNDHLELLDLGKYKFKDFSYPVKLYQLNVPGLEHTFPAPRIEEYEKRVVVLPFLNSTGDPELQHLGEGLAAELILALGKCQGIRVISRSTSFLMAHESRDIHDIAKQLNANVVIDGEVRYYGSELRTTVEVVDSQSETNIWSDSFKTSKEELFKLQEQLTQQITEALGIACVPEQFRAMHDRQSDNPEAYDFYLRGRRFYWQFSSSGVDLAIQMFERAIEADDSYALAYAGLADSYSYKYQHVNRTGEVLAKADESSKKAIEIAPSLAEALVSRGIVLSLQEKFEEAEKAFQKAIEYDPTLYLGWFHYGRMNFTNGKLERAARLFEQAHRVEPEDYQSVFLAAQTYSDLGNDRLAYNLRKTGVENADRMLALNPGDTRALYLAANALVFLDEREKSLSYAQRALLLEPNDSMVLYNVACIYALLSMPDEALSCLERAYNAGLTLRGWFENDSNLNSLRGLPRFQELMERMVEA